MRLQTINIGTSNRNIHVTDLVASVTRMAKGGSHAKGGKAGSVKVQSKKSEQQVSQDEPGQPGSPFALQQKCLNIFRDALKPSGADGETLQEIKGHLYGRDFATAFGKEDYLRVYASRWSPSRALAYLQIFSDVQSMVSHYDGKNMTIVSLGGGAGAELVAIACWLSVMREDTGDHQIHVRLLDIADWHTIVQELHRRTETPPDLSKYASATAKETNRALLPEKTFTANFTQQDVLDWPEAHLDGYCKGAKLITLMFTLNELYSMSIQKTQRFLAHLTAVARYHTFLLVVDSPGSYSTVSINATAVSYTHLTLPTKRIV